ncbi:MAG: hypothetical protein JWP36_1629 [Paucimonas sp.]|nr:hypothetical protein [Paucimonas sp.]
MDEIVRQAMAKWPNVPHCTGWLALDARGNWRMRDERAQAAGLAGDRIRNPTLLGFINRNYLADDAGRWYFQNGPQRVYVDLELTPFICHTDPVAGLALHTGEALGALQSVVLTPEGNLVLATARHCAALDDRDLEQLLPQLELDGRALDENLLAAWIDGEDAGALSFMHDGHALPVERLGRAQLAARFGFDPQPRLEPGDKT